MTIPMNNTVSNSNSSRERAQHLYDKNVELESKRRKAAQAKIPSDPNAWQQMRENYESILLEDHAFSEQHDIEYALWQLHYKRIEELRAHYTAAQAQNGKVPARPGPARITKIRSQFKTFLSEATGFYHDLMVKIRGKYGLSLGYIPDDSENDIDMKKGLISCHRCFIYLGDLARYKGLYGEGDSKTRDFDAASSYYKQAATLWPSSGNPHHQLAILASYSGDELLSVYRYFRSLAVDTPFTTARDNLIIAFEKNRQSYCQLLGDSKAALNKKVPARVTGKGRNKGEAWVSLKDRKTEANVVVERECETLKALKIRFVRLNGILFTRTSLETFGEIFSVARSDFLELLSSGQDEVLNFGSDDGECKLLITRLIAIMIFTVYNAANKEREDESYAEILQRCVVLENALTAIFEFMGLIVERCVQLDNACGSYLVPGIMIFVEWLACCEEGLGVRNEMEEKQVTARCVFWKQFVCFVNKVVNESEEEETGNGVALPEDMELRGFLPLVPGQLVVELTRRNNWDGDKEKKARVQRIVAAGKALTKNSNGRVGKQGLYFDSKSKHFVFGVEAQNKKQVCSVKQEENGDGESEEEEEEEVIVFKPCVPEKHSNNANAGAGACACASSVNENMMQYPPPPQLVQPEAPKWMKTGAGEECVESGYSNLLGKSSGVGIGGGNNEHLFQDSESMMIPSKFDSVVMMTRAPAFESIPLKTKKAIKSPVGRPVRHFGPPPGFNTPNTYMYMDEPLFGVNIRNRNEKENPPVPVADDYRWLDGYQLPCYSSASAYSDSGFGNSLPPHPNKLFNTSSLGMESFPFPGKQVSSSVIQASDIDIWNQNGWHIPQHSNNIIYQQPMQQQIRKRNEDQFFALPQPQQQYQGQSLWEGRFFV